MSTTVTDRTAELERYIARLHNRVRRLESQLDAASRQALALHKVVTTWQAEAADNAAEMPAGLHRLQHPSCARRTALRFTGTYWEIACACGWISYNRPRMCEGAEAQGASHLAEAVGE